MRDSNKPITVEVVLRKAFPYEGSDPVIGRLELGDSLAFTPYGGFMGVVSEEFRGLLPYADEHCVIIKMTVYPAKWER